MSDRTSLVLPCLSLSALALSWLSSPCLANGDIAANSAATAAKTGVVRETGASGETGAVKGTGIAAESGAASKAGAVNGSGIVNASPIMTVPGAVPNLSKVKFVDDATCERLQPGRLQSARELLAESKDFKLNASQSSVNMQDAIRRARSLGKGATLLKGRLGAEAIEQYHKDLGDFQKHVQSYRAHLEQVEKDMGHCKDTEKAYNEHLKKTKLHTAQFHLPDIPPPHLCPNMMLSEAENARLANQMKQDRERLALSEMELAEREAQLKDAVKDSTSQDEALRKRNRLTEEERKLAGEFAGLKTELDLLNTQHRALLGGSTAAAVGVGQVSGKVKGK